MPGPCVNHVFEVKIHWIIFKFKNKSRQVIGHLIAKVRSNLSLRTAEFQDASQLEICFSWVTESSTYQQSCILKETEAFLLI